MNAGVWPCDAGVIEAIIFVSDLKQKLEPDRVVTNASFDFVLEVVRLSALGLRGRQGLLPFRWSNLVASKSDSPFHVREFEGIHVKVRN